ncbi:hypothetical protein V0242_11710 [Aeromonas hydrophila]|uniref:hypothetical protein n=1 Tax=Aeromonas hydrophila TaxID=644 RepID=UPI002ED22EA9|nr:hypothetical protein V0242_11710 [Aeromonas hydrophila]
MKTQDTLFVNIESKKIITNRAKKKWATVKAISTINYQFGKKNKAESMLPFSGFSKELKALGFESQETRGKFIRKRVRDTLKEAMVDSNQCVYAIRIAGKKMHIVVADIDKTRDGLVHGVVFKFEVSLNDRMSIVVRFEEISRNQHTYKGSLVHHMEDMIKIEKRGSYTRQAKTIEITEEVIEKESEFTVELAKTINKNAEIINHNAMVVEKLIQTLIDNGIQVPYEMIADHSEDEYQLQDQFELDAVIANTHPIRYQ